MKKLSTIIFTALFVNLAFAQEKFVVPQLNNEQKKEVLYNHVIAYAVTGINFAKSQEVSPKEYGIYLGNLFKGFWNPNDGFEGFGNGIMYALAGIHPDNELQIVNQSEKMIQLKMKNIDLPFKSGSMFGITFEEYLECSYGLISVLAKHMNVDFSHRMDGEWYIVTLVAT